MVRGAGRALLAGWQEQILLHARGVPRRHVLAVSQSRQRDIRRRDGEERDLRRVLEIAGRGDAGRGPGRLARPVRGQRHAAEQALPEQPRWDIHRIRCAAGHRVQRGRAGPRGHGRGHRGLPAHREHGRGRDEFRQRDDGPVRIHRARVCGSRHLRRRGHGVARAAGLRLHVRGLRFGWASRSRGGERAYRRHGTEYRARRAARAGAASFYERWNRTVPRCGRRGGTGIRAAQDRPRRGSGGLRPRWRPRFAGDHQRRACVSLSQ